MSYSYSNYSRGGKETKKFNNVRSLSCVAQDKGFAMWKYVFVVCQNFKQIIQYIKISNWITIRVLDKS